MIIYIVTALVIILLLLFVDWQPIITRLQNLGPIPRPKARAPKPVAAPKLKAASFDFEEMVESMPAVQTMPILSEPVPTHTDPEIEKMLAEADIHFRKGELKAAEEYYLKVAAKDPRCSKAYSRLGVIYLDSGDNWEDAEAAFRQALKTDPDNGFILNNLGLVLYHQDKYADAIRNFESAVRHDDLNAARHANLGMGYMAIRQYAKAESSFKKALKLAPNEMEYKDLLTEAIEKKRAHKTMVRH